VYCHNPTIIASRLRGEARPDYLIPFKLKKEEAVAAVQKLCRFKPLLPKAFRDSVRGGEVSGLYVPFWLFSSDIDARLDGKGQRIATWSDSKYRYTKTDTFAVRREATISLRHVPADGSAKMDDMLMESLEPFDYKELRDFSMAYISGHFAETYDVDAQTAQSRVIPRMREGAAGLLRGQVSGYTTFRNENMTITPRTVSNDYAMLPVWTLMHEFGGKRYYFAMNAQTGKMVGSLPVSWARFFLIMGGAWLVSFGLFLLISLLGG
jgi:hypothetical protein